MFNVRLVLLSGLVLFLPFAAPTRADDASDAQNEVRKLWDIEAMVEQAAKNIGDRYNLSADQREQTKRILVEDVTKFLDSHPEMWPLVRDLTRIQLEGKSPTGPVAARIGKAALPILAEAHEAILAGNERWRHILTDEQKKVHDFDLRDIERTFQKMESNFQSLADGSAERVPGIFPEPNTEEPQPALPPPPSEDFVPPPIPDDKPVQEHYWDIYVREFIQKYELNDAQSESAYSILRECKERAETYKESRKADFADADRKLREARSPNQPPEVQEAKIKTWKQLDRSLKRPIVGIFEELKKRLEILPDDAQRKRAEAKEPARPSRGATPAKVAKPNTAPDAADSTPAEPGPAPDDSGSDD